MRRGGRRFFRPSSGGRPPAISVSDHRAMSNSTTSIPNPMSRATRWHIWSMADEVAAALATGDAPAVVCARFGFDRAELARLVDRSPAHAIVAW